MEELAKARKELEELYLGIADDSVNLTFGDLADVKAHSNPSEKRNSGPLQPISEFNPKKEETASLAKWPSLDFSRGLEQSSPHHYHHHAAVGGPNASRGHHHHVDHAAGGYSTSTPRRDDGGGYISHVVKNSMAYDEMSNISGVSAVGSMTPYQQGGGRRRPGIPHSNICTICSNYIYVCRQRCLVCGRVYCRQCVGIGMGEMTEGRKCMECLGRRFSQRYIQRAGQMGCCMRFRYPSMVMQQELKWAEKGPRRTGERRNGHSVMMSRSRSPIGPRTPTRAYATSPSNPPSFVTKSPRSPYSPTNHHPLPF